MIKWTKNNGQQEMYQGRVGFLADIVLLPDLIKPDKSVFSWIVLFGPDCGKSLTCIGMVPVEELGFNLTQNERALVAQKDAEKIFSDYVKDIKEKAMKLRVAGVIN